MEHSRVNVSVGWYQAGLGPDRRVQGAAMARLVTSSSFGPGLSGPITSGRGQR
jgi:hypothetical protein